MAEQQMKQTIEITTVNATDDDELKDNKQELDRKETVYDFAMQLKTAFDDDIEIYEPTNWRLTLYWCSRWLPVLSWSYGGEKTISMLCIIIYIVYIIIDIILLFVAFIKKSKNNNTFNEELNLLFGIKKKDLKNIYNLDSISTHFVGALFMIFSLNICFVLLIQRVLYSDPGGNDQCSMSINGAGSCILQSGTNSVIYFLIGVCLAMLCSQFYALKDEIVIKMMQFKEDKILTIPNSTIGQTLDKKICQYTLKKWSDSLHFSNRKIEYLLIFVPCAVWIAYLPEAYEPDAYKIGDIVLMGWLLLGGSVGLSLLGWICFSVVKYFKYPALIMRVLRNSIEGDTVQDFIVWWQLRKYYIENEVRVTGRIVNVFLSAAFTMSLLLLFVTLTWVIGSDSVSDLPSYAFKIGFLALVLFLLILALAQSASTFYEEQLKHKFMLVREKLRIEAKYYDKDNDMNDDGDIRTRNDEQVLRVIDAMIVDIENTVVAIEMAGVRITPNMMLLIRGYIASGIVAVAAAFST